MKNTVNFLLGTIAVAALGAVGMARMANALNTQAPVGIISQNTTVPASEVSDGDGEMNNITEEKQEMARLQLLSKITPQQAQKAAESKVGGKANKVELEDEDGNLIYTVKIGNDEVKIDAGNGRFLYVEKAGQEDPKSDQIRSSIQVSQDMNERNYERNEKGE